MSRIIQPRPGAQLDFAHPLAQGLVGYWLCNEGSGGTVRDYSPAQNHGTMTNMDPETAWVAGENGWALNWPITVSGYHVATPFDGTGGSALSVFVRMRLAYKYTDYQYALDNSPGSLGYMIRARGSENYWVVMLFTDGGLAVVPTTAPLDYNWHHLGFTYGVGTLTGYYDGSVVGTSTTGSGNILQSTHTMKFGMETNTTASRFCGVIEGGTAYNRALSADEVAWLYAEPYAPIISGRPRPWIFDVGAAVAAGGPWGYLFDRTPPTQLADRTQRVGLYDRTQQVKLEDRNHG